MIAYGLTIEQLRTVADAVPGVKLAHDWARMGRQTTRFRLALDGERYRRHSYTGRKVAAVCWHGHRDFLRTLFGMFPEARIKTIMADYRGVIGFARDFPATGYNNAGSNADPLTYRTACECDR